MPPAPPARQPVACYRAEGANAFARALPPRSPRSEMKMVLKLLVISTLLYTTSGQNYKCGERSALLLSKRSAYEFSMKILDRVAQNNDAHFVFSPLSTWLQLTALAEGAKGRTLRELWSITKHHRNKCFKSKLRQMLRKHSKGLKYEYRRKSLIVIDQYMGVKKRFIKNVLQFYGVKTLLKNFDFPERSAQEVNEVIDTGTNGVISESVYSEDFNGTVMLLSDNVFFKSAWKFPFDAAETKIEPFISHSGAFLGDVNMMTLTGYFNTTDLNIINARIIEIPCVSDFSMLILMPLKHTWIGDTFFYLKRSTLTSVFNRFKTEGEKLVNLKLPRFKFNSTVDNLPELLFDMGVKSVFDPNLADLSQISDYTLFASLMTQVADIEVTEEGVRGNVSPGSLINETSDKIDFLANKPFAYMVVERKTQFILFAGTYSVPTVY